MNTVRMTGGLILLALAVLLAVLTAILPPENMMFMIGDANVPLVPAIVMGVVGIWLMARSGRSGRATTSRVEPKKATATAEPEKAALNKRLEAIGWGLFLIMLGGFSLVPHEQIPEGYWSVGLGIIMLGLNATRYVYGIRMSGFTTFLGLLALVTGITELLGFTSLEGALFLIILGAYLLVRPWFDRRQLFGKVEEG